MEVRYAPDPVRFTRMTTAELQKNFLVNTLFKKGKVVMVYSHVDRAIIGSAVPVKTSLKLKANKKTLAADYFAERRELGIINIGNTGKIVVDSDNFEMAALDCLYIGMGCNEISFTSSNPYCYCSCFCN